MLPRSPAVPYKASLPPEMDSLIDQTSRLALGPRRLYVDALNFHWLGNWKRCNWNYTNILSSVRTFVQSAHRTGYELKVFIDGANMTSEAIRKWQKRREREVREGKRRAPQGMSVLIGEAFQRCGVEVCYSYDADNDDTMASYAQADGADVLSQDKDFFRYRQSNFTVYEGFTYSNTHPQTLFLTPKPTPSSLHLVSKRDIINPPPETRNVDPSLHGLRTMRYIRGAPSALVRLAGNAHIAARPLRQAVYARLGLQGSVLERFPVWDEGAQQVRWDEQEVQPSTAYDRYLNNPRAAVIQIFGSHRKPDGISWYEWNNHVYAMHAVVLELCLWGGGSSRLCLMDLLGDAKRAGRAGGYLRRSPRYPRT
ncbi:hypothetical protein HK097_000929 [Rhizophlyctis rosea]|uniref:Uncharacterized protein n=1 Tax=Rhizophlyctis rosea TaxID=64517 RepID=A0AAD5X8A1_9FUNG|nr:hypothetical protein HK097_000929 [Rhizophlyctis rosea]